MAIMSSTDPYRVLGVDRSWPMADIEARYRERIRDAHPDRHVGEGAEAMARADQWTRELTEAMSEIRQRHSMFATPGQSGVAGPSTPGANRGGWMGTGTNPADDWATGSDGDEVHGTSPADLAGRRRRGRRRGRPGKVHQLLLIPFLEWLGFVLCSVGVFALLGWRASMPEAEAGTLTPVLGVAVIAALVLAGRLLYSRFFAEKRGARRARF